MSKYAAHYGTTCSALLFSSIGIFLSFHPVTPPTVRGAENQEGTGVVFTCTVNDAGNVALEWSSTNLTSSSLINLTAGSIDQDGMVMNTLTIVNVTDAGGDYTCTASYESGNSSSSATLNTVSASTNLNISAVVGDVKVLVCISETAHVWTLCFMESSTIELAMGGSGSGGLTTNGITNGSTLVFSPVEFGDEGCYQCVPQLQEGSTTFNEVQVTGTLEMCVYYMGKIVLMKCLSCQILTTPSRLSLATEYSDCVETNRLV